MHCAGSHCIAAVFRYYFEANKDRLDRVPDLSDSSGGLSNPVYFNFVYYILWKQIAQETGPDQREVFGNAFGKRLTDLIVPGAREQLQVKGTLQPYLIFARLYPTQHILVHVLVVGLAPDIAAQRLCFILLGYSCSSQPSK